MELDLMKLKKALSITETPDYLDSFRNSWSLLLNFNHIKKAE